MHSRTRARPARSPLLTLIGKRRSAFASVADAVAYLEPGLQFGTPGTITVYGSRSVRDPAQQDEERNLRSGSPPLHDRKSLDG